MFIFNLFVLCLVAIVFVKSEEEVEKNDVNLIINRYEMCKDFPNTPAQVHSVIKKLNETVFECTGTYSSPYVLGDNIKLHVNVDTFENGVWTNALTLDEKDPCKLLNEYIGDNWHAIQKEMNMTVGECPIPKGDFEIKNYILNVEKYIPLSYIPKGHVRIQSNATQGDELVLCLEADLESI